MASLYRCRARVGYKPSRSDKLILFEDRQIEELTVKLKHSPNFAGSNTQGGEAAENFSSTISTSGCQVVISDPYLTGIAWPALYDAASMWSASQILAVNHVMMPPCQEGQDPYIDKCFNYGSIDESGIVSSDGSTDSRTSLAHILISLWYEVNGTSFGSDYFFRVNKMSISNSGSSPRVTLSGVEPKAIVFNQNLINVKFEEGMTVEDALKQIANESGFTANFCQPTGTAPPEKFVIPRSSVYKGITPDEAMKRLLLVTNGSMLSLPIKEHANSISVCSRGDLVRSCSVFYLGKGLYEGYEISGEPPPSFQLANSQQGSMINEGDAYVSASFESKKYSVKEVIKEKRIKALEKVKKVKFDTLFQSCKPKCPTDKLLHTAYGWKGAGPKVDNTLYNQVILHGIFPNKEKAISYLPGEVVTALPDEGQVLIKTEFWLNICAEDGSDRCFGRYIYQRSSNLSSVKVKNKDKVTISQEIGTSTEEKPEFVTFYIKGHQGQLTVLDPQLIWNFAAPTELAGDQATKTNTPPAPTSGQQNPTTTPSASTGALPVGKIGSTGQSDGPHLHAEIRPPGGQRGSGIRITKENIDPYVSIAGLPASAWGVFSPYGMRSRGMHFGIDFSGPGPKGENINGQPVSLTGGATVLMTGVYEGFGNTVVAKLPNGNELWLAHLQDNSIPPGLPGMSSSPSSGKTSPIMSSSPVGRLLSIETAFKGVPRVLRITPGRTVLSFVTDYDNWLEQGGPRGDADQIDPGIWIPQRFRNWFVSQVEFVWRQGDLRVNIEASNAWGNTIISAPSFKEYLSMQRSLGEFNTTKDYYGYIRSVGDLCYPIKNADGKFTDSCKENCTEAQEFYRKFTENTDLGDGTNGGDVSSAYPTASCQYVGSKYPKSKVNAIINAARAGGIKTKAGFAGVVGNAILESTANLSSTIENNLGAIGIFQWLDRRPRLESYARSKNKSATDFGIQMEWFVQELKGADYKGKETVSALNSTGDPAVAAEQFETLFERSGGDGMDLRIKYAREIFADLNCS